MILKSKLITAVKRSGGESFNFKLDDIVINGSKRGCCGFISNPSNAHFVYVNTEECAFGPLSNRNLVRYAKDEKDYRGGRNQWFYEETTAKAIVNLLTKEISEEKYKKLVDMF